MNSRTALFSLGLLSLLPRLPGLWRISNEKSKVVLSWQLVLLALYNNRLGKDELSEGFKNKILKLITVSTLGTLMANSFIYKNDFVQLIRVNLGIGMVPILSEAVDAIKDGGLTGLLNSDADIPAIIAMQLGMLLNHNSASSVILLMVTGGELLEDMAMDRASSSLHSLLDESPGNAHVVVSDDKVKDMRAEELEKNQVILVKQNEVVPVDCILMDSSYKKPVIINESLLTGEMIDSRKYVNDKILGGSVNHSPEPIILKTKAKHAESIYSIMKAQLKIALEKKASIELQSKKLALAFTPFTIILAAIAFLLSIYKKRSTKKSWEILLSIFMSATPCPAAIGVPVAMISGMSVANRKFGASVKTGGAIEALSACTTVVLDKTGTLTLGQPTVIAIDFFEDDVNFKFKHSSSIDDVYVEATQLIASIEQYSTHVLANSVCDYYDKLEYQNKKALDQAIDVESFQGEGISGKVKHTEFTIKIGTFHFCFCNESNCNCNKLGIEDNGNDEQIVLSTYFVIFLKDSIYHTGRISFVDELRPNVKETIDLLTNKLSKRVLILSGDRSNHLKKIASILNITEFYVCLPTEKVDHIRKLQSNDNEVVLFVGDGANDAAALAQADVGMSIDPTNLSSESATIVLLSKQIKNIPHLLYLSENVTKIAKRTVSLGMLASVIQMLIAATGLTSPFVNAMLQEFVDLSSIVFALQANSFTYLKD